VSPIWFDWDGELLRFRAYHQAAEVPQTYNANPRVAMSISDPDNPYRLSGSARRRRAHRARSGGELLSAVSPTAYQRRRKPPPDAPAPGRGYPPTPRDWVVIVVRPTGFQQALIQPAHPMTTPNTATPEPRQLRRMDLSPGSPANRDLGPRVSPGQARGKSNGSANGTLWVTGFARPPNLSFAEPLLESTTAPKRFATGIVNIWTADAKTVAEVVPPHQYRPPRPIRARHRRPATPSTPSSTAKALTTRWSTTSTSLDE